MSNSMYVSIKLLIVNISASFQIPAKSVVKHNSLFEFIEKKVLLAFPV